MAVAVLEARGFTEEDFARSHPGGSLGRRLLTRVKDVMHAGDLPHVHPEHTVQESLLAITQGRLGLVLVMNGDHLLGIVTDGDLRRALQKHKNLLEISISEIMTSDPVTIFENAMVADAEDRMMREKIKALVVLNVEGKVSGILEIFDD